MFYYNTLVSLGGWVDSLTALGCWLEAVLVLMEFFSPHSFGGKEITLLV